MARRERRHSSGQAGALPEIRLQGASVVFYLDIALVRRTGRLVLRCDTDGQVWASLDAIGPNAEGGELLPPSQE